jgi:hypothetical protein
MLNYVYSVPDVPRVTCLIDRPRTQLMYGNRIKKSGLSLLYAVAIVLSLLLTL